MIWDSADVMDRWPAAPFRARCVLVESLDRLWHLVSTAVQRNNLKTQQQRGAEWLQHAKKRQDEKGELQSHLRHLEQESFN